MALAGPSTTWKHGTNGAVSVNTDFTSKTRSVSMSNSREEVDATTFGDSYRDYEASFSNSTITVQYKSDTTLYSQLGAIYNGLDTVTFELGPTSIVATNPKITGSMVMTSLGLPYNVGDLQVFDVTWRVTGAVTFGVFT